MTLLKIENLSVEFQKGEKKQRVVDSVSFQIQPGEILGIVGESGSGKSTLMYAIKGLLPKKAEVTYDKLEMMEGIKIGMVFQDPLSYLNPGIKVGHQLIETIRQHQHLGRKEAKAEALQLLEQVGIDGGEKILHKYPDAFSGGMRQRIILAIALAMNPSLLIADEPTTALDVLVQRKILKRIRKIARERNMAVLLVSHDLCVVGELAKRVIVMKEGKIVEDDSMEKIFSSPEHPYTQMLLERFHSEQKRLGLEEEKEQLLCVEHLRKEFAEGSFFRRENRTKAVQDVSFSIHQGETYGLVGESGCGKTTLARLLTGLLLPDEGTIQYYGKKRIQMVFQDSYAALDPRLTLSQILEEPLKLNKIGNQQERKQKIDDMIRWIGLPLDAKTKRPHSFSGGELQRICIARALILDPELIILDEPVSALDVVTQEQILKLLTRIQEEKKIAYLFISHDLPLVKRMCKKISVMYQGTFVESGDTEKIYHDPQHSYTKTLLNAALLRKRKEREHHGKELIEKTKE